MASSKNLAVNSNHITSIHQGQEQQGTELAQASSLLLPPAWCSTITQ